VHGSLASLAESLSRGPIEEHTEDYARLNALAARLYGVTPGEYAHVVSTFPLLPAPLRERCVEVFDE